MGGRYYDLGNNNNLDDVAVGVVVGFKNINGQREDSPEDSDITGMVAGLANLIVKELPVRFANKNMDAQDLFLVGITCRAKFFIVIDSFVFLLLFC